MSTNGYLRRVDELGRIVLPIELRRALEIEERDLMNISMEGDALLVRKHRPYCLFCGADADLLTYRHKSVCRTCLRALNDEDED